MSVDQRKVVDAVGTEEVSGAIVLTIADQLDWSDVHSHLLVLQEKINDYLDFLESGEIFTAYPAAEGKKLKISVIFRYPPPQGEAFQFLGRARSTIEHAGYSLSHEVYESNA